MRCIPKILKLKQFLLRQNEQNNPLSNPLTYSNEFPIGQSTSETPLLKWYKAAFLYFF